MRALTVKQPSAQLIAVGIKEIENRGWAPSPDMVGKRIAIHAGQRWDEEAETYALTMHGHPELGDVETTVYDARGVSGAVVATAVILAFWDQHKRRGAFPLSRSGWPHAIEASPWFIGPVGWRLARVVALEHPIPCKGALGLWRLPPDVVAQIPEHAR